MSIQCFQPACQSADFVASVPRPVPESPEHPRHVGSLPVIRRRIFDIVLAEGESFGPGGLSFVAYRRFRYGLYRFEPRRYVVFGCACCLACISFGSNREPCGQPAPEICTGR